MQMISRAPLGEKEIGIAVAETIGGTRRFRGNSDVEPLTEFAHTANGQHLQNDFLPTPFGESTTRGTVSNQNVTCEDAA